MMTTGNTHLRNVSYVLRCQTSTSIKGSDPFRLLSFRMSTAFKLLKEERICPPGVQGGTFHLSPLDLYCLNSPFFLSWPFFFDYDVDANRLKEALEKLSVKYPILCGRVVPDADTCYSIEVRKHELQSKTPNAYDAPCRSIPRTPRRSVSLSSSCNRT